MRLHHKWPKNSHNYLGGFSHDFPMVVFKIWLRQSQLKQLATEATRRLARAAQHLTTAMDKYRKVVKEREEKAVQEELPPKKKPIRLKKVPRWLQMFQEAKMKQAQRKLDEQN